MSLDEGPAAAVEAMASKLYSRLQSPPGELGTARAQVLRDFLRAQVPKRFEVSAGLAFDCHGHLSKPLDVVIFDATVCPRVQIPGNMFLFPCEAVVAVGQVKSSLTAHQQFREALEDLSSATSLDRSANCSAYGSPFGEALEPKDNHLHRIFSFLFITGAALNPDAVALDLHDALETPIEWMPNVVVALDSYLITYGCDYRRPKPTQERNVVVQAIAQPVDAILSFCSLLAQALDVIRTSSPTY